MQQRLAIARAILHDPAVLLLDEPYTGLDQDAAALLDELLREVAIGGRTVVMTTHDLWRGHELADRIAILSRGKIAFDAPCEEIDPDTLPALYADVTGAVTTR
jgi:ABC-type multidrug transport system ATPase subunit